ncbi:MAG: DUF58 domain-containing protein [Oscillospiraceae bacterium]|nr:DUF58 domain-containing protein [Oscillospiraceae bacterium]
MEFLAVALVIFLVFALQNYIYKRYAFQNLEYHCRFSVPQACEGDEIELIEEILNKKRLPLPWLKAEITTSCWLDFAGAQSVVTDQTRFVPSFFMVKGRQRLVRRWKLTCLKRGEFSISQVTLVSTDLLGYTALSQAGEAGARLLVLPRPIGDDELAVSPRYLTGDIMVRRQLVPDPFYISGVREYTGREPVNMIHWNATAREQQLMVFQNDFTSRQSVTVVLNMQSREFEQHEVTDRYGIENAIRVCAALFDGTLATGMPLRFMANGTMTSGGRDPIVTGEYWGREHVESLLQILARLQLHSTEDFGVYLQNIYSSVSSTDMLIVTAYLNEAIVDFAVRKQAAGTSVRVLMLGHFPDGLDCGRADIRQLIFDKGGAA